jgi:hypothetical protein
MNRKSIRPRQVDVYKRLPVVTNLEGLLTEDESIVALPAGPGQRADPQKKVLMLALACHPSNNFAAHKLGLVTVALSQHICARSL